MEIEKMTFWEYELRMRGHSKKAVYEEYYIHLHAWVDRAVNATDRKGKYKYRKFDKFFDMKKRLRELDGTEHKGEVSDMAKSYMRYMKGE